MNDMILNLTQIGFTSYEAKAYIALLQKHPAIGYEVSKLSRIPTSKIYEALTGLVKKGAVICSATEPVYYSPVNPDVLLEEIEKEYRSKISGLRSSLKQVPAIPDIDITWNLPEYSVIIDKMTESIGSASEFLLLSLFPEEAERLKEAIQQAENRNVKVIAGVFGESSLASKDVINLEDCGFSSVQRIGKRLNVVVSDAKEVVIGEMNKIADSKGIWTTNPSIVLMAKEYIKHDIWGHFLIDAIGEAAFQDMCITNETLSYLIRNR